MQRNVALIAYTIKRYTRVRRRNENVLRNSESIKRLEISYKNDALCQKSAYDLCTLTVRLNEAYKKVI